MIFTLAWGNATTSEADYFSAVLNDLLKHPLHHWQGIREDQSHLWLYAGFLPEKELIEDLASRSGIRGINHRTFSNQQRWGESTTTVPSVANFVLRELQANLVEDLLPQIRRQIEVVASRPGCAGCALASETSAPHNLLGITYWQNEADFREYAGWASQHPWKDVIAPVTRNTPLRLFARKIGQSIE